MTTPTLKKEYLDMIPEFNGEPTMLNRFITICDKIVNKFFVTSNVEDFQNEYLFSSILAKLKGQALDIVVNSNTYAWNDVKQILIASYLDKRDCFTLNLEMAELKQENGESPFKFYEKVQKLLNLQIAFFVNKEPAAKDVLCTYARQLALRVMLRGLQEPLGSLMRTKNPKTLEEALNMLTNDFQFKNNKFFQTSRPNIPQKPQYMPIRKPMPNHQFHQHNPNYLHRQPHNQPQRHIVPNSIQRTNQTYQPTPMSISTRQTGNTVRQNKLYHMVGKPIDEDNYDHSLNQLTEQMTDCYLSEELETDHGLENYNDCNEMDNSLQEDNACGVTPENEQSQNHFLGLTIIKTNFP